MNSNKHFVKLFVNPIDNGKIMNLPELDLLLLDLSKSCYISSIHIFSLNLGFLSDLYFDLLYSVLKLHSMSIDVFTDFKHINASLINNFDIINVHYDFLHNYDKDKYIFNTIKAGNESGKIINIKTFDTECLKDTDKAINILNSMQIKSWEIIPDHRNINKLDYTKTEKLIEQYTNNINKMNFSFQNKLQLDGVLNLNNYNQTILHITPETKVAIQKFNNKKYSLQTIENIDEIENVLLELENLQDNFCKKCTSKIKCMANYYNNYTYTGKSCCGLKNLLEGQYK